MRPHYLYPTLDGALDAQPLCTHVLRRTVSNAGYDFVPVRGSYGATTFKGFEEGQPLEYDTLNTEWEVVYVNQPATTEQRVTAARFDTAAGRIPAHEFLEKGVGHMKDRARQRDAEDGERSMKRCVEAFNALEGTNLTETQGWKFMVMLKMARSVSGDFTADDFEDMAAYAGLAGESASIEHTPESITAGKLIERTVAYITNQPEAHYSDYKYFNKSCNQHYVPEATYNSLRETVLNEDNTSDN